MAGYADCGRCQATGYRHVGAGWYRQCKRCGGTGQITTLAGRFGAYLHTRGLLAGISQMSREVEDRAAEYADDHAEEEY
jgi:hypothetical protein